MARTKIQFSNKSGQSLQADLLSPESGKPKAYAIFAHCFTCNKNLTAVKKISEALNLSGFAVLRFDFTGLGHSEGDFADTNFSTNIEDLISAADYLSEHYEAPKLMIGHSLGGSAAIFAGAELESVQAIATIGAPSSPEHVTHLFSRSLDEIKEKNEAEVNIGGRPFKIKQQFLDDIASKNLKKVLDKMRKALLILHSPQDNIVEIKNAAEIYSAAFHPKSFITLDGADHLLNDKKDAIYAGKMIASWADKYIESTEEPSPEQRKQVLVRLGSEGLMTEIYANKHTIIADEPTSLGGTDLGPTPYDLLLGSLGTCTVMTLRLYAKRKKWDIQEIKCHLSHGREHAADCKACDEKESKIDVIHKTIEIKGDIDEKQRKRLLEISKKCPVHRTLLNTIEVRSDLELI